MAADTFQDTLPPALQFLTEKQLADLLRVSERTLERWRVDGKGPQFVSFGRKPLYRLADVENFARQRTFSSTSELKKQFP